MIQSGTLTGGFMITIGHSAILLVTLFFSTPLLIASAAEFPRDYKETWRLEITGFCDQGKTRVYGYNGPKNDFLLIAEIPPETTVAVITDGRTDINFYFVKDQRREEFQSASLDEWAALTKKISPNFYLSITTDSIGDCTQLTVENKRFL